MHRLLAIFLVAVAPAAAQNLVINGDFERSKTIGCAFNLSNPDFNAAMPGCTGFGTTLGDGELDIMQGGTCGYGLPAASGSIKLGIAATNDGNGSDAFSIRLKTALVPGHPYRLRFQANAYVSWFAPDVGAVEVGLSLSATEFGVKVGELVPSTFVWSEFDAVIVPETSARFLTVRYQETKNGWNHIDDFALEDTAPPGFAVGADGSTIHVQGATPGSLVAVLTLPASGSGTEPVSPCMGTLAAVLVGDGGGGASFETGHLPGAPLQLQALDLTTGAVSPLATVGARTPGDIGLSVSPSRTERAAASGDAPGERGPSPPSPHP